MKYENKLLFWKANGNVIRINDVKKSNVDKFREMLSHRTSTGDGGSFGLGFNGGRRKKTEV